MKLIVGLGNPDEKYKNTRHNVGFMVLNKITDRLSLIAYRLENQFNAEITQTGGIGKDRIIFAKPVAYMNNSGEAVAKLINYYKIDHDDLLVISDDIDLDLGTIRTREQGSFGGHKGLESIIQKIGDNRFLRIKIGIGSNRSKRIPSEKYVLTKFTNDGKTILNKVIDKTVELMLKWMEKGEFKEETIQI